MRKSIHPEAQIIWGLALDDAYGDEVRVTVIAAGFDAASKKTEPDEAQSPRVVSSSNAADRDTGTTPLVKPDADDSKQRGNASSNSIDETSEHEVISSNDPGYLDIPDFLR